MSVLDVDQFTNDQHAENLQHDPAEQQANAERISGQLGKVVRSCTMKKYTASTGGNPTEHRAGDPAVCRQHADLSFDTETFANDVAQVVEDFRKLPPDSRWVSTDVTKNRASSSGMRSANRCSASGSDIP